MITPYRSNEPPALGEGTIIFNGIKNCYQVYYDGNWVDLKAKNSDELFKEWDVVCKLLGRDK
jgi:hypothetical protein